MRRTKNSAHVSSAPPTGTGLAVAGLGLVGLPLALEAAKGRGDAVASSGHVPFSTRLIAESPLPPVSPLPVNWGRGVSEGALRNFFGY